MTDAGEEAPAASGDTAGGDATSQAADDPQLVDTVEAIQSQTARIGLISDLTDIPEVARYMARVGARSRSLTKAAITESAGRYPRTVAVISFGVGGMVEAPEEYAPTPVEQAGITTQWALVQFPTQVPFPCTMRVYPSGEREEPTHELPWQGADPANVYACWHPTEPLITAVEVRKPREDGGKDVRIWTYFSDRKWRVAEPDQLPLYGLERIKNKATIFVHEGPKAARAVTEMLQTGKWRDHPFGADLGGYSDTLTLAAHVGWLGGAERAGDVDWQPLKDSGTAIVLICDNDRPGKDAARVISKSLGVKMQALFFDDDWPKRFDLADNIPDKFFKTRGGRRIYVGTPFRDMLRPATWATDIIPASGRGHPTSYAPRRELVDEWMLSISPPMLFHRSRPSKGYSEKEANVRLRAFSDAQDTVRLLETKPSVIADGIAYTPGAAEGIITEDGRQLVNTWAGTRIKPRAGSCMPFLRFMTHLLPQKSDRREVMRWFATLVARPDIHMAYGLIFRSEVQGVGKTTLAKIAGKLVGMDNVSIPSEAALAESGFNGYMARKRLVICNEFYSNQSIKVYNRLKASITDDEIDVNEKYLPQYTVKNHAHFFMCSNDLVPILLDAGDRRFLIPTLTERKREHVYWDEFNEWLSADGLGIILRWASQFVAKHGPVQPGAEAPMTGGKAAMIESGVSDEMRLLRDVAEQLIVRSRAEPPLRDLVVLDDCVSWLAEQGGAQGRKLNGRIVQAEMRRAGLKLRTRIDGRGDTRGIDERVHVDGRKQIVVLNFDPQPGEGWPEIVRTCRRKVKDITPETF